MTWRRLIFVLVCCAALPRALAAQRIQLPTQLGTTDALDPRTNWSAPAPYTLQQPASPYGAAAPYNPTPSPVSPYGNPSTIPFDPYATPSAPYANPAVTRPPPFINGQPAQPYAPSPYGQTTPYYQPGPTGPDSLYPNGFGDLQSPQFGNVEFKRFLQRVRFSYGYIAGGNDPLDVGINDMEIAGTFDVPLFQLEDHFLITPGFALHLWDGPVTQAPDFAQLPPQTYDAYLDVGWNPKVTNWFSAELGVRVGAYTDFSTFSSDSFRIMGRALGVVNLSPTLQFKLGVIYLDRNQVKILPAGGLIWDPSEDRHWEIFFPRPKFAQRLSTVGNYDMWIYLAGEYGGGAWTFERDDGSSDNFDYNDFRVMLGLELLPDVKNGRSGFVEVGYVFKREVVYVSLNPPDINPPDSYMLRAGFSF